MSTNGEFHLRLGYTETTLLFYYWLITIKKIERVLFSEHSLINWLYTTSGYYDKDIAGDYFNFDSKKCLESINYKRYMSNLFEMLHGVNIVLSFHTLPNSLDIYKQEFLNNLSEKNNILEYSIYKNKFYNIIQNKRVLIINPRARLMQQQYNSGNVHKIYHTFPKVLAIEHYENTYTFFNTGPDLSILETANKICIEIKPIIFDIAIVSCGAYSSILGNFIRSDLCKDVYITGGDLLSIFGIKTGRNKKYTQYNEHWISVPENLRPANYEKIEGGCYW